MLPYAERIGSCEYSTSYHSFSDNSTKYSLKSVCLCRNYLKNIKIYKKKILKIKKLQSGDWKVSTLTFKVYLVSNIPAKRHRIGHSSVEQTSYLGGLFCMVPMHSYSYHFFQNTSPHSRVCSKSIFFDRTEKFIKKFPYPPENIHILGRKKSTQNEQTCSNKFHPRYTVDISSIMHWIKTNKNCSNKQNE